jgi:gliding motility-associated-like protein
MRSVLLIIIVLCTQLHAQDLVWARSMKGRGISTLTNLSPGTSICNSIAVDHENNVYITGFLNDTVDADPGPAEHILHGGNDDPYLAKYNSSGDLIWAHVFPSAGWNYGTNVAVDSRDNVVITGYSNSPADFDPGPDTTLLAPGAGHSNYFFIARYTTSGDLMHAVSFGGQGGVLSFDMAIDKEDAIYVTGNFYNTVNFNTGSGTATITSNGSGVFFAKYDSAFQYVWARSLSGTGMYGGASSIACSAGGAVYLSGYFGGTVDFDPGTAFQWITASTTADRFFAKYDTNGNLIWAHALNMNDVGAFTVGRSCAITTDADDNLYMTGNYKGAVDFDPGSGQAYHTAPPGYSSYLCKYDAGGNLLWAESIDATLCFSDEVEVDCKGTVYITGTFGYADFDPSPTATAILFSSAPSAAMNFLAAYSSQGSYYWAKMIGNNGYGSGTIESTLAIKDQYQYVAGGFKQSGDFDPGPDTVLLTTGGVGPNTFFAKYRSTDSSHYSASLLGPDITICEGADIVLQPAKSGWYQWQDQFVAPQYPVNEAGTYWVKTDYQHCTAYDTIQVKTEHCETLLEMPNVFSPNGDGVNDLFMPVKAYNVEKLHLTIYNRWGQKLFETEHAEYGWNGKTGGKECSEGTYYWLLSYTTLTDVNQELHGCLTLLR